MEEVKRKLITSIREGLGLFPAIGVVGARQVGKTTLISQLDDGQDEVIHLDLELETDLRILDQPQLFFESNLDKLVILDEVQRKPELFPLLRAMIDRNRRPGRYLVLGSASPELLRQSSESLAGRIEYHQLHPFSMDETDDIMPWQTLWWRGGFPRAALAGSDKEAMRWMRSFIRTYLERDLPQLGFTASAAMTHKLLTLLAAINGNILNVSLLARTLDIGVSSANRYLDFLEHALLIQRLQPHFINIPKRLIKAAKLYVNDTGMLHSLLNLSTPDHLMRTTHPGHSFETFVLEQLRSMIPDDFQITCFRTAKGAEIDFVISGFGNTLAAIEVKYSASPDLTKGNVNAFDDIKAKRNIVIAPVDKRFFLREDIDVIPVTELPQLIAELFDS